MHQLQPRKLILQGVMKLTTSFDRNIKLILILEIAALSTKKQKIDDHITNATPKICGIFFSLKFTIFRTFAGSRVASGLSGLLLSSSLVRHSLQRPPRIFKRHQKCNTQTKLE